MHIEEKMFQPHDDTRPLLPDERAHLILEQLQSRGRVLASELAQQLNTSEHTVRHHLRELADAGHCKRVYGGALLTAPVTLNAATRMRLAVDRKARLATAAIVRPGQTILLDSGSTNIAIAEALPDNAGLTVITNSPDACSRLLGRPGFDVILIGGRLSAHAAGSLGATALLQVQQVKADLCFVGVCAFDTADGIASVDPEEAELKRAIVKASGQVAVALTSDKLMTTAPFFVAPASAVEYVVVEADLGEERLAQLRRSCGNVIIAA